MRDMLHNRPLLLADQGHLEPQDTDATHTDLEVVSVLTHTGKVWSLRQKAPPW